MVQALEILTDTNQGVNQLPAVWHQVLADVVLAELEEELEARTEKELKAVDHPHLSHSWNVFQDEQYQRNNHDHLVLLVH
jgi:hypothetical protein